MDSYPLTEALRLLHEFKDFLMTHPNDFFLLFDEKSLAFPPQHPVTTPLVTTYSMHSESLKLSPQSFMEALHAQCMDKSTFGKITFPYSLRGHFGFYESSTPILHKTSISYISHKKSLEVCSMANIVEGLYSSEEEKKRVTLIDVGCGKGHLSCEFLNRHFQNVVSVDHDSDAMASRHREKPTTTDNRQPKRERQDDGPRTRIHTSISDATSWSAFQECVSQKQLTDAGHVLCCLHGCGRLSLNVCRMYAESLEHSIPCESVVSIACCYNLLITERLLVRSTETTEIAQPIRTPPPEEESQIPQKPLRCYLSSRLDTVADIISNRNTLMAASQVPYHHEPSNMLASMSNMFERAMLQYVLTNYLKLDKMHKCPNRPPNSTILEYTQLVLKSLPNATLPTEAIENLPKIFDALEKHRYSYFVTLCLRGLLGQVVEAVLLVDRGLYIKDAAKMHNRNDVDVSIIPVCPDTKSARNYALVARRK
eukprot:PhF_6_TR7343/c0_g1_i1/m.11036